jgi:hypothetical protein
MAIKRNYLWKILFKNSGGIMRKTTKSLKLGEKVMKNKNSSCLALLCRLTAGQSSDELKVLIIFYELFAYKFNQITNMNYFNQMNHSEFIENRPGYSKIKIWSNVNEDPEMTLMNAYEAARDSNRDIYMFSLSRLAKTTNLSALTVESDDICNVFVSEEEESLILNYLKSSKIEELSTIESNISDSIEEKRKELVAKGTGTLAVDLSVS